ncbi:hypothetical protein ACFQVC_11200 [Streptomyces monticola]|uniref:Integral membrane protein n=1 Tax=Streptomyces monticola TaxID=2666263 RepID=A0ABW2JGI7_9ACTN
MIVTLIVICEVGFWVLLAAGLSLRYLARMPRTGAAVLLCEPLLEVLLLVVSVIDLRNGAQPDWKHGLAALYIGYTVAHGHATVKWLDSVFAHRFAGGPAPVKLYGARRAKYEWKVWLRSLAGAVVALGLLQIAIWYVGDASRVSSLRAWQGTTLRALGIHGLIALTYTVWPKKAPQGAAGSGAEAAEQRPVTRV